MSRSRRDADIKAPDGYLLGGLRRVRKDGTVLFQRGWWQCPIEWAGEEVWLHESQGFVSQGLGVEAWPPGVGIWANGADTIVLERTDRSDAKPAFRRAENKAWHARNNPPATP